MGAQYLIEAANSMVGGLDHIDGDSARLDPRSMSIYLSVGCKALRLLEKDDGLFQALEIGTKQFRDIAKNDIHEFISAFVRIDRGLMVEAGMDPRMVHYLYRDAQALLAEVLKRGRVDTAHLRARIAELSYSVCKESEAMDLKYVLPPLLKRSLYVIGGGAIVSVNAAADLSGAFPIGPLSEAFGAVLIGMGIEKP